MENNNKIVTMTIKELDDLVYKAVFRAARKVKNDLYKGIEPFFLKMNDDLESLLLKQESMTKELSCLNMDGYEDEE
jgi:hypothetical protein